MIHDLVSHLPKYRGLDRRLGHAIDFIDTHDLASLAIGRHEVAGDDVFALVNEYTTKQPSAARWEAHRTYVDLQIMLAGVERMDVTDAATLVISSPYDEGTDNLFFAAPEIAKAQMLAVPAGQFAIFMPHDAHAPTILISEPATVRKIVFKIRAW